MNLPRSPPSTLKGFLLLPLQTWNKSFISLNLEKYFIEHVFSSGNDFIRLVLSIQFKLEAAAFASSLVNYVFVSAPHFVAIPKFRQFTICLRCKRNFFEVFP